MATSSGNWYEPMLGSAPARSRAASALAVGCLTELPERIHEQCHARITSAVQVDTPGDCSDRRSIVPRDSYRKVGMGPLRK